MAKWTPARKDTMAALADEILHNYRLGRVIVAVDGDEGETTGYFADDLAQMLRDKGSVVFRASMTDFSRPRAAREAPGTESAEDAYRDRFDHSLFRRVLVDPFRLGGSAGFVAVAFDVARNTPVEPKWLSGPEDAILLVDGPYLNRPELRGLWNFSVWLERGDAVDDEVGPEALYLAQADPRGAATAMIDLTEVQSPRRVFADSC